MGLRELTGGLDAGGVTRDVWAAMRRIPDDLLSGTFTLGEARGLGVGRRELRTPRWRHLAYNRYRWAALEVDEDLPLRILLDSLPKGSALSGFSAARVLGLDVSLPKRPEVVVPPEVGVAARRQATIRRVILTPEDLTISRGLPVTTPSRTCFDLAGRLSLVEAVVLVDMALHTGLLDLAAWHSYVISHRGRKGVAGARTTLEHVEPKAESPMESRLRMLLVGAGLPRPQAQVALYDAQGNFAGRPDLYYPEARLGVEYDGENHRDRMISDNRRQNRLHQIGVTLLRYTVADLSERPHAIVGEVRAALTHPAAGHLSTDGPDWGLQA